jgi:hypothetical protein
MSTDDVPLSRTEGEALLGMVERKLALAMKKIKELEEKVTSIENR